MTIEEIDVKITKYNRMIAKYEKKLNKLKPTFMYADKAAELSKKIEEAKDYREMLIEMQREGVVSDR